MTEETKRKLFEEFVEEMRAVVFAWADEKGYKVTGIEPSDFLQEHFGGHDHHLGEIILKAIRYRARRAVADLVKIAGWAFVIWRSAIHENVAVPNEPDVWRPGQILPEGVQPPRPVRQMEYVRGSSRLDDPIVEGGRSK